ncbi:hypothetical protein ACX80L_12565 [Arthrobacter sp. MDT1-48-3]
MRWHELVQVQWVEYSMARSAWVLVLAGKVWRRQLEGRRLHGDG